MFQSRSRFAAVVVTLAGLVHAAGRPLPAAQPMATMVADIGGAVSIANEYFSAPLDGPVILDGVSYFFFDDGVHGLELWRTDGTAPGTSMLADICPGACGATGWAGLRLRLAKVAGRILFTASDGVHGLELWVTGGTPATTRMVVDLRPGLVGSSPNYFLVAGDRLLFWADDGVHGSELWASDGTAAGTALIADLRPGPLGSSRRGGLALGNGAVFGAAGANPGLWYSDGTTEGTNRISTVSPYQQSWTDNAPFARLSGRMLFQGDDQDGAFDPTLWVTDGTVAGTRELAPISSPYDFASSEDVVFFSASDGTGHPTLWRTDGTLAGTTQVVLPDGLAPSNGPGRQAVVGGVLFFAGNDAAHGTELWRVDGTTPSLVRDIVAGPASSLGPTLDEIWLGDGIAMTPLGPGIVFFADDGIHGRELWISDGTAQGTHLAFDLVEGATGTVLDLLTSFLPRVVLDGALLFRERRADGIRLWRSDGMSGGTALVEPLHTQMSAFEVPKPQLVLGTDLSLRCFGPLQRGLLFTADDGVAGREPWFSDGTETGTYQISDLAPGPDWGNPTTCNPIQGRAVLAGGWSFSGLLATTGAEGSIETISPYEPPVEGIWGSDYLGDRLYLAGSDVWSTDGTPESTYPMWFTTEDVNPLEIRALGDRLFVAGGELAVGGATPGEIQQLTTSSEEWSHGPKRLSRFGDSLLFVAAEPDSGEELWTTDGTPAGTHPVADLWPGPASSLSQEFVNSDWTFLTRIVPLGPIALFAADDGVHGEELWRTDGTAAGTSMVRDIVSGAYPSAPRELTRVGDLVFFSAESLDAGRELWVSGGSAGSTRRVADLVPGPGSSVPQELAAIRDELWFSAWTPDSGREPWRVRRQDHGVAVERLADLAPGPLSSSPLIFRNAGADVYTVANDNLHGFELWKLRDPDLLFADDFESSGLALWASPAP